MMAPSASVRAIAYASIANLGHGLDVFGVCVDAGFDEVEIGPGDAGIVLTLTGEAAAGIPSDPDRNTAGRALQALMRRHDITAPIRVNIRKGLAPGSGLGSSATSAAAAVVAANEYFGLDLTREQCVPFAAEGERAAAGTAHADNVAASIFGGFTMVRSGTPMRIVHLPAPEALRFVVATPRLQVETSRARAALPEQVTLLEYVRGCASCAMIVAALASGDIAALGEVIEGSFVDEHRSTLIPGFASVRDAARQAGSAGVCVSGAGPTVAAVVGPDANAEAVARAMKDAFNDADLECNSRLVSVGEGARIVEER